MSGDHCTLGTSAGRSVAGIAGSKLRRVAHLIETENQSAVGVGGEQVAAGLVSLTFVGQRPVRQIGGHPSCGERPVVVARVGIESGRHPVVVRPLGVVRARNGRVVVDVEVVTVGKAVTVLLKHPFRCSTYPPRFIYV